MAEAQQDVEQVVRAHAEMWNEQDTGKLQEVISETYTEYNPVVPGGKIQGADAFEEWFQEITSAFPDFQAELLEVLTDGTTAMVELHFTMTHEGEFNGIPPTGRTVEFDAMGKFLIEDGRVQELHNYFDTQELFEQLGVTDG